MGAEQHTTMRPTEDLPAIRVVGIDEWRTVATQETIWSYMLGDLERRAASKDLRLTDHQRRTVTYRRRDPDTGDPVQAMAQDAEMVVLQLVMRGVPACAGREFEHHRRVIHEGLYGDWKCMACGDTGNIGDVAERLMQFAADLDVLRSRVIIPEPVILLPSDGPSGSIGRFFGVDVYRVNGLPQAMIGVPPLAPTARMPPT